MSSCVCVLWWCVCTCMHNTVCIDCSLPHHHHPRCTHYNIPFTQPHPVHMTPTHHTFPHHTQAKALRMRRDLQRKFLFTEPMIPRAGEKVTVYYNPDNTVLRGRPDIWVRGSWNRWDQDRAWDPILMQVCLSVWVGGFACGVCESIV